MRYNSINVNIRSSVNHHVDKKALPDKDTGVKLLGGSRVVKKSYENARIDTKSEYLSKREKKVSSMDVQRKADIVKERKQHSVASQIEDTSGIQREVESSFSKMIDKYFSKSTMGEPILGVTVSSFKFPSEISEISPGTEFIYNFRSGDGEYPRSYYEEAKREGKTEVTLIQHGWRDNDGNQVTFELVDDFTAGERKLKVLYNRSDDDRILALNDGDVERILDTILK